MRCLVLGAGGFVGRQLCHDLLAAGYQVIGFDRQACPLPPVANLRWQQGDFRDSQSLVPLVANVDAVLHLISATLPQTSNDNPLFDLQANVASTLGLLDGLWRLPRPPRLLFLSSGGTVYGVPRTLPISEDHPTEPLCAYGIGKRAIEQYLALYRHLHGLDYLVLRLANPYGPGQPAGRGQGVIPVFLRRALAAEALEIWGDGSVVRDYFYIDDLSRAIVAALHYSGPHRIFNIGSGSACSLNRLVEQIGQLLQRELRPTYLPGRPCDVPVNVLDIRRARHELGWMPQIDLAEGLRRTLCWLQATDTVSGP
ncbi:NAD-dependent epimerase/dehydratase family protein [Desulfuromonas thiophila]|uniref:NAD-dependent epimerase/dehydratase family protein n=1 Tax=Desulfuromonas thiophila TaxID=57664 RepID=UPI0024A86B8A|nr:NAD-dependent epimerase/dehydratase family protein [Desulfuromonas thiophila]